MKKIINTMDETNINIDAAEETKMRLEKLSKDINEGKLTREEIKDINLSLISEQNYDNLKGFFPIINDKMPSDARVDFIYYPTYCVTMIMIRTYLMGIGKEINGFNEAFKLALDACTKRNLAGHGYEAEEKRIEILNLFVESGLFEFLKEAPKLSLKFTIMIETVFKEIETSLRENKTVFAWDKDFRNDFQKLVGLKKNHKLKVFVYGSLMRTQYNHMLIKDATVIGDATVEGFELYDTGCGYPAVKYCDGASVSGELYQITEEDLISMDRLEGNGSLYTREFTVATDEKGDKHFAIIYVYNHEVYRENKIHYWKEKSDDKYVWYASYGSNLNYNRFMKYINNCEDTAEPMESKPIIINHRMYFANKSYIWHNKGVAFIDPEKDKNEITLGRMYLITREQFEEIKYQEGHNYRNQINLGKYDGREIVTFTNYYVEEENQPSQDYLNIIRDGIKDTYPDMTLKEITKYLKYKINQGINIK